jgi:hypothetical protein
MTSIRYQLLNELVARVDAITDVGCVLRNITNQVDQAVMCIAYPEGEEMQLANTNSYNASFRVEVMVIVRVEDADDTLDGDGTAGSANPYRYIDRMLTEVQKVVHTPDQWGTVPDFTDVAMTGHVVEDPTEANELEARLFIEFSYRHDYQNPGA